MLELKPDIAFKKRVEKLSGAPLNTCMQCGSCSVVCNLSPLENPFPRKEMVYAGWGMSGKLLGSSDIWLCHQCGDCSTYCPRGVQPADVIAALRQETIRKFAVPKFMGKLLSEPKYLPLAILLPVVVIAAILLLAGTLSIPDGPVDYSKFFPHDWLNMSFSALVLFFYVLASFGFGRFWKSLHENGHGRKPAMGIFKSFWKVKNDIISHTRFNKCESTSSGMIAHFLVFYGFILLLLVTLYAIFAVFTGRYPLEFTNPFKLLGNLSSLMLLTGLTIMFIRRLSHTRGRSHSSYSDWLFLIAILLLTLSGIFIEAGRFFNWPAAYYLYFFHLVCVWFVVIYLPYSKFGHVIYRTLAMTYDFSTGRK